jgi:hypothetical protein
MMNAASVDATRAVLCPSRLGSVLTRLLEEISILCWTDPILSSNLRAVRVRIVSSRNRRRNHSAIGYITPQQAEAKAA